VGRIFLLKKERIFLAIDLSLFFFILVNNSYVEATAVALIGPFSDWIAKVLAGFFFFPSLQGENQSNRPFFA